jgi:tetratricopeptide (TPR) repeat protein
MQKFFKRIWRWFQQVLGKFLGGSKLTAAYGGNKLATSSEIVPLTDTDYEFLFSQLLEGIAHGWHEGRILKFFEQLGDRGKTKLWVNWLDRFGEKVLASPSPNLILAARMMRLGELAQSFPKIEPIGHQSHLIARQLYARQAPQGEEIWEYGGPDLEIAGNFAPELPPNGQQETYTLEELATQLETDPELTAHLANELGLDNPSPQKIMEALMAQFNIAQDELANQHLPEDADGWLSRGLQQANLGDLEGAIASWDQAVALDPQLSQAWHNRGSALGNLGRLEEALASFRQTVTLNPQDYQALFNLGSVLEVLGQNEEAIASYQKVLEIEPTFELATTRLNHLQSSLS